MMEFLLIPVPGGVTGLQLLIIAIVKITWGSLAIVDVWWMKKHGGYPLWGSFSWSLGWYLLGSAVFVYLVLAVVILRDNATVPLWFLITMTAIWANALLAFRNWARGKMNGGLDGGRPNGH